MILTLRLPAIWRRVRVRNKVAVNAAEKIIAGSAAGILAMALPL